MAGLFLLSGLAIQAALGRRQPIVGIAVSGVAVLVFLLQAQAVPDPKELARRWVRISGPILWQEEGMQTTVAVSGGQNAGSRVMYLDGRHQANDTDAMVFIHRRIGLLPAVLHEQPRRALVVGLGGGVTPGGLSQFPGLQVDVVELSDSVIKAAAYFSHVNFDVLQRPNVHVRHDDGRNFLLRARTPYDVITADAILPHHAGANNLNSVEYFRLVRDRLAEDGVALHWNGGMTDAEHKMILRAFVEAFPQATLWGDGSLMIGSKQPMTVSRARIESLLARPEGRHALGLMHVGSFDHLVRMFRASPADIAAYLGPGQILSDDQPSLEYFASLPQGERDFSSDWPRRRRADSSRDYRFSRSRTAWVRSMSSGLGEPGDRYLSRYSASGRVGPFRGSAVFWNASSKRSSCDSTRLCMSPQYGRPRPRSDPNRSTGSRRADPRAPA